MRKISILITLLLLIIGLQAQHKDDCKDIECPKGYRCSEGVCIKQQHKAKKTLCYLNQNLAPIKCTNRNYQCQGASALPSCGFSFQGVKNYFSNDCLPCLDRKISFFYRVPCQQAPSVCLQDEQCVNGKCMKLFQESAYKDYVACSSNRECRPLIEICVAGKCVKLTQAAAVIQKSNIQAPPIPL